MDGIRLSLSLVAFALVISFADSHDGRSYLSALRSPVSGAPRQPQPRQPVPPPFRTNNYDRSTARSHQGGCSNDYKLDFLQLTLQWGPGFCATSPQHCMRSENRRFTIHGMWPQFYHSYSPSFCCFDNTFNYNLIQPLLPELNKYWPSFYSENSRGYWSHEWLKHGTCLRDVKQLQGEKAFFSTTLDIVKNLPILETLAKAGIVPDDKKPYNSVEIQNVLRQLSNGSRVKIECDLEAHQPIPLMKGLDFCFDTNMNFIDCPPSKSRCQRQVLFLTK